MATSNFEIIDHLYTKITHTEATEALAFSVAELRSFAEDHVTEEEALRILTSNPKPPFMSDVEWNVIGQQIVTGYQRWLGRTARSVLGDIMTEEHRSFGMKMDIVPSSYKLNLATALNGFEPHPVTYGQLGQHTALTNDDICRLITSAVERELEAVCGRHKGSAPWIKDISSSGSWTINVGRDDLMMTVFKDGAFIAEIMPTTLVKAVFAGRDRDFILDAARGLKPSLNSGWIMQQVMDCIADKALPETCYGIEAITRSDIYNELFDGEDVSVADINERLIQEAAYLFKIAARRAHFATLTFGKYTISDVTIYGQTVQCRVNGILTGDLDVSDLVETFIYHRLSLYQEGSNFLGEVAEEITASGDLSELTDNLCCAILYTVAYKRGTMFDQEFHMSLGLGVSKSPATFDQMSQEDREQYEAECDAIESEYEAHRLREEGLELAAQEAYIEAFPYGEPREMDCDEYEDWFEDQCAKAVKG